MAELPCIPDFFKNKNVFMTGGTGFIGKVLIEKLLRSCPDLKTIYLLMREKKGQRPEERIKAITDLPLFDLLKSQNPQALEKIKLLSGDIRDLGLGLSPRDRQIFTDKVNIVFHIAASVRFDDSLTDAVILNTRGTREVCKLALEAKSLNVLVHISTTYCQTDKKVVEESLYPPHADWRKTIEIVETVDKQVLNVLTEKYIYPLSNTYTFTKSLGEHVVHDLCKGKIPAVIYRPSIIISTALEPVPGWIDNFNGPIGLLTASGKGIVRSVYSDPNIMADYVPVDVTVKAIIIASWKQATYKDATLKLTPEFYNGSNCNIQNVTVGEMVDLGKKICKEVPLDDVLWYPNGGVTKCYYYYYVQILLYHLLPAVIIDCLLRVLGKKPILMKLQRRIYKAMMAISHFSTNQWQFNNAKCLHLQYELLPKDVEDFAYREDEIEVYDYFLNGTMGARKYLLNEGEDLDKAKKHAQRMWVLAHIFNTFWYLGLLWLFFKIDVIGFFVKKYEAWIEFVATD